MTLTGASSTNNGVADHDEAYDPDLVREFATRFNGTKTPPVDSGAIMKHIWAGLGRRGLIDRHGRYVGHGVRT